MATFTPYPLRLDILRTANQSAFVDDPFVVVLTCTNAIEAQMFQSILEDAGLEVFLEHESLSPEFAGMSNIVPLYARRSRSEEALEIIKAAEQGDTEAWADEYRPDSEDGYAHAGFQNGRREIGRPFSMLRFSLEFWKYPAVTLEILGLLGALALTAWAVYEYYY